MFQKILVASDLTEGSIPALRMAVGLARETGAGLVALHVCEPRVESRALLAPLMPSEKELIERIAARERDGAERVLDDQVRSQGFGDGAEGLELLVLSGMASEVIPETGVAVGADLIVVGTHGRRGLKHALMGSVAERVVRCSEIPVLTVRGK